MANCVKDNDDLLLFAHIIVRYNYRTHYIHNTQYADDLTLIAESRHDIQNMLDVLDRCCRKWGFRMKINCSKTKLMPVGNLSEDTIPICLNGEPIEEVCSFEYLGSILELTCSVDREVDSRLQKAGTVYQMWRHKVFRSRNLSIATKVRVFQSLVVSVLLCGAETWPMNQQNSRKLKTFQMRDILGFTLLDKKRNEDILRMTGQPPIEIELRKCCLQWFEHVQRVGCERTQKRDFRCRPVGKKRQPGGVSLCWVDTTSTDLSWIRLEDCTNVVTDRRAWRGIINQICWPDTQGIVD